MFEKVIEYLDSRDWRYPTPEQNDEESRIIFGIQTQNSKYDCMITIFEDKKQLSVVINFPKLVPKEKQSKLSEQLLQLNASFFSGGFEIDKEDGEMRFRTGFFYGTSDVSLDVIDYYINSSIFCVEDNYQLLKEAIFDDENIDLTDTLSNNIF